MTQQAKNGLAALAVVGLVVAATAEPAKAITDGIQGDGSDFLQVGGGVFDVQDDDRVPALSVEYRLGTEFAYLAPALGTLVNTDGGIYGYLGFHLDVAMGSISIMPGLAAGYYCQGDSKDLGGPLAFRQSIGMAYRLGGGVRLGFLVAHISNGSIYGNNPGQEDAQLTLAMPFGPLFD